MHHAKLAVLSAAALALAGTATVHLAAQPEPYRPISTADASYELSLPPGTYQHLVVAFEGAPKATSLKAIVKAPSGDLTLLVNAGDTLIVPLSATGWTISQPVTIKLNQPATQVHVAAMTQAGPVRLEAPKK